MIVYHQSPKRFKTINFASLGKRKENHANGALGLWAWTAIPKANTFGKFLYTIEIENPNPYNLPIKTLFNWSKTHDETDYRQVNCRFLTMGYNLFRIIEENGSCDMVVCLDTDKLKILKIEEQNA